MYLGRVIGRVWSTVKDPALAAQRLLLVQPLTPEGNPTGKRLVVTDAMGAGDYVKGANIAGFTVHLLPLFGTLLAILFLGEEPRLFHALGFGAILAGVVLATWARKPG